MTVNDFDWKGDYARLHSIPPVRDHRPLVGITGNYDNQLCTLAEGYYRSVLLAGGTPVVLPPYEDTTSLAGLLDRLDAIVFSGGGDINPLFLDEEPIPELHGVNPVRDRQELLLARMAYNRQIPMLGICKGIQVIAAALGGKVYQDLATQKDGVTVKHSQDLDRTVASHRVDISSDSLCHRIFGCDVLHVNSFHHQAVRSVPDGFRVSALSSDGVVEAMENTEGKSVIGVQWHPECFCLADNDVMMPLFHWLVNEAKSFAEAKCLHDHVLTLDSHCDTPMFFDQQIDFCSRDERILVDIHKMTEGRLDASIMVAYLKQEARDENSLHAATIKADSILDDIEQMVGRCHDHAAIAYTPADLYRLKREGKRGIMLGIENGYAIGRNITNVEHFRRRGVVYMTLCHNGDNDLCDSARGNGEHGGVSSLGSKVIAEMNSVGMMVDLSHASERSFYDAVEMSRLPIVCSHSSARALCDHPRNLTDDQLKLLSRTGGVAQVTFYNGFLRTDGQASIADALAHIDHMVKVAGIEHVGIGTDFDGDGGVTGLASAAELINLTRSLLARRYSEHDIELLWGGNFLRVMQQCQDAGLQL